jgi:hypothetical protein
MGLKFEPQISQRIPQLVEPLSKKDKGYYEKE